MKLKQSLSLIAGLTLFTLPLLGTVMTPPPAAAKQLVFQALPSPVGIYAYDAFALPGQTVTLSAHVFDDAWFDIYGQLHSHIEGISIAFYSRGAVGSGDWLYLGSAKINSISREPNDIFGKPKASGWAQMSFHVPNTWHRHWDHDLAMVYDGDRYIAYSEGDAILHIR